MRYRLPGLGGNVSRLNRQALACVVSVIAAWGCADDPVSPAAMVAPDARVVDGRQDALPVIDALDAAVGDAGARTDRGLDGSADAGGAISDATPAADAGPETDARLPDAGIVCAVTTAQAERARRPVDLLWIIDSSPSMHDEIAQIQAKLNAFAARIADSGLDYRVALVSAEADLQTPGRDYIGVCIPPPLSRADGCPDTNSERYLHVREPVHSADGLDVMLGAADVLDGFLRPEARLHVVMVSDDDHRRDVALGDLQAANLGADLVFHSIVTLLDYVGGCGVFDEDEICSCGDERGRQYIALSEQTGGRVLDLCTEDWDPLFAALNEEVAAAAEIPCAFDIPEVRGAVVDPARINVSFVGLDGMRTELFNVDDCAEDAQGWRFDDPISPQRVLLCPNACGAIAGEVEIEFGCDIRKAP